ncbi:MAG TPA: hypothetical protein VFT04_03155 [Gemmatimonadales bacterium]|nr:hypothetical protein [Gemmatimonadales bacterium]
MIGGRPPLRIGVLADGPEVPAWLGSALSEIVTRGIGELALIVERDPESDPPDDRSRSARLWQNRSKLAFALAERLDARRAGLAPGEPAMILATIAPSAAVLRVRPATTRFSDVIGDEDVARIRAADLDVIVRAGFRILRGGVLSAARHGVWSFHHGDNRENRGGPPGVWEVLEDSPVTGVTLQRLTEELDGGVALARSVGATRRFSFAQNIRHMYRRSSRMLVRSLERLHAGGDPRQASAGDAELWDAYQQPLYRIPSNGAVLRHAASLARRYLAQRLRNRGRRLQWSLAWHYAPGVTGSEPHGVMHRYREIPTPRDRFWADPFVVRDGARWWMFFEELIYQGNRGTIAVWEMGPKGPIGEPSIALETDCHLSYPQVFRLGETWYMIPETNKRRRIELYRADGFPHGWVLDRILVDEIDAVDATLLEHQGHWYLFTSIGEPGIDRTEELHILVSDSPFGPFTRHPENPVVADVRRARMGGQFFRHRGRLYRPAQSGVPVYGAGMAVHEVLDLSPSSYSERVVYEIRPKWRPGLIGSHTINAADGLSVIDLLRAVRP